MYGVFNGAFGAGHELLKRMIFDRNWLVEGKDNTISQTKREKSIFYKFPRVVDADGNHLG
jgi:hypothetical protein